MPTGTTATSWQDDGFAVPPEETVADGGEIVYRAYGGTSPVLGNCFFAPILGSTPINYWTAELLERELNAALWGNDFAGVTIFVVNRGARYQYGPIAHDRYSGTDEGQVFYQRAFFTPSGIFKQVKFLLNAGQSLRDCVKETGSLQIAAGRYAREASSRAKRYRQ
jgi:hypothetical protein